jgi:hypothetical protein
MHWTVVLEDEHRIGILSLNVDFTSPVVFDPSNNKQFKLLKYLDPYGDTIFNKL